MNDPKTINSFKNTKILQEERKSLTKYNSEEIILLAKLKYDINDIVNYVKCSESTVKKTISGICSLRNKQAFPIYVYDKENLVKIVFGYIGAAKWIKQNYNINITEEYLSYKISNCILNNENYMSLTFEQKELPSIEKILSNNSLKSKLEQLVN